MLAALPAGCVTALLLLIFPYQAHQKPAIGNSKLIFVRSGDAKMKVFSEPRNSDSTRIMTKGLSPARSAVVEDSLKAGPDSEGKQPGG